ncbi:MAG TPA: hypothetical protein PL009_08580 [Flavipsychrobacter sp.]|nr:hypothetical protein [Flavipsychrobacter sp.]
MGQPVKNIFANLLPRAWSLISLYFFTPVLTNILGLENYGLIAFHNVLYGIIVIADAGITSSLDKEFATSKTDLEKRKFLNFFSRVYLVICLLVAIVLFLGAEFIGERWLNTRGEQKEDVILSLRIIAIAVSTQLFPSIYLGTLMGSGKQVTAGLLQFFVQLAKIIGGILLLIIFSQSLLLYFLWHIVCNLAFTYFARKQVIQSLPRVAQRWRVKDLPPHVWKYMKGMFIIGLVSAIMSQCDRILASQSLTMLEYAIYSLITIICQMPLLASMPIVLALFPFLNRKIFERKRSEILSVYYNYSFVINVASTSLGTVIAIFGITIMSYWQPDVFNHSIGGLSVVFALLAGASTLSAMQQLHFYYHLAEGVTKYIVVQNLISLLLFLPLFKILSGNQSMVSIAAPFFVLQLSAWLFHLFFIKKLLLKRVFGDYFTRTTLLPLIVNLLMALAYKQLFHIPKQLVEAMAHLVLFASISIFFSTLLFKKGDFHQLLKLLSQEKR